MATGDQRTLRDTGPAGKATLMSVGSTYQQGRALLISCTVSGNIVVQLADTTGDNITVALPSAGVYEFNWAVTQIVSSGTTATATYYNLY